VYRNHTTNHSSETLLIETDLFPIICCCREDDTLTSDIMKDIGRVESLQKYVRQADYAFYTAVLDILIPDVLRPIPSMLRV
jgi:hypothetical protein